MDSHSAYLGYGIMDDGVGLLKVLHTFPKVHVNEPLDELKLRLVQGHVDGSEGAHDLHVGCCRGGYARSHDPVLHIHVSVLQRYIVITC